MSNSTTSARTDTRRPVVGLRRNSGRVAVAFFRLPLAAYQHNTGPAVGHMFLMSTHLGRKTGQPHQTVAMVLHDNKAAGEAIICAAWGAHTDWFRNLQAHPAVQVQLGGQTFTPQQRFLTEREAFSVATRFRCAHPHRLRLFSIVLGGVTCGMTPRCGSLSISTPFIAFRPNVASAPQAAALGR